MKKHNFTPQQIKAISDSLNADMNMDNWECFISSKEFTKCSVKEKASALQKYNYWAAKSNKAEEQLEKLRITPQMEREYILTIIKSKKHETK